LVRHFYNKMKKRFKKIVEWDIEPERFNIMVSSFILLVGIASLVSLVVFVEEIHSLPPVVSTCYCIMTVLCFTFSIVQLVMNLGCGRKVHWEEVK